MSQPVDPYAPQREAAVAVFTQSDATLYEGYLAMITEWLAGVKTAVFAGGVTALTLMPDPYTVFSQGPKWAALVDQFSETIVNTVLRGAYGAVLGDDVVFATRPFVINYIADVRNRMKNIPNEVFGQVKEIINAGTGNGASIPDIAQQIHGLLDATGSDKWKNRAMVVARTETIGAYNGGTYDAYGMIVAGTGDAYNKRWLATEDDRTRPHHREADGQTVPYAMPFIIGGFPLMFPGDPAGPASEVIQCRCTLLLEKADDMPTSLADRQSVTAAAGTAYVPFLDEGNPPLDVTKWPAKKAMPTTVTEWNPEKSVSADNVQEKLGDAAKENR